MKRTRYLRLGAYAAATASIIAVGITLGFDFPPWPARAQVDELEQSLKSAIAQQAIIVDEVLLLRRDYWRGIEEAAEQELGLNPASISARRELIRAQDGIAQIDRTLDNDN